MKREPTHWRIIAVLYIFYLFSYTTCAELVQLMAPRFVVYGGTATLTCKHTVPDNDLHKVEFMKDERKILQYIKDRNPPFVEWPVNGANMEYADNGTTIKLKDVRFEASGSYSCEVSMTTPIYTEASESVSMKVIEPQRESPKITFKKSVYVVGENLEANCTSSAARPVPHLTWFINGKEVDITLVTHYPHTHYKNDLMSATAKLTIEVSALHAGENGYLEISCHSTIPDYPMNNEQYADHRKKTVSVQIIPAPVSVSSPSSGEANLTSKNLLPVIITCLLASCAIRSSIP